GGTTTTPTTTNTTSSTSTSGQGGGAGASSGCNDGVVTPPEECEDGNTSDTDGCSSTCMIEADCGNSVIEPGEECDAPTECSNCTVVAPSVCVGAQPLTLGDFNGDTTGSTISSFGDVAAHFTESCSSYTNVVPLRLYRHQNGEYPSGIAVFAHGLDSTSGFDDAIVWSYVGCAVEPAACSDDASPLIGAQDSAMFTPVLPPFAVLYVAIADYDSGDVGSFSAHARPFRLGYWFSHHATNPGFQLEGEWTYDASSGGLINDSTIEASADAATSESFYVGGIATLAISFQQQLDIQTNTSASIEVSFDDGPWTATSFYDVTTPDSDRNMDTAKVAVPAGALFARLRFVFDDDASSSGSWIISGLTAGPDI
ncbi:MAG: hypothetical protein JRI23_15195, partial [Deltaproteobacteria bacterium]|nr:hypothetical protein [Deltaproteobacteria bacterium]MBW2533094.1 hypothetical protein [Deltaproteobacteria bacterium]